MHHRCSLIVSWLFTVDDHHMHDSFYLTQIFVVFDFYIKFDYSFY
jgi:hypothetical protein